MAGGCFWCVESDLEKIPEVISVVSGYSGGETVSPTYNDYTKGGHREVVLITYDAKKVSYKELVKHFLRHIDPTDAKGAFTDRGIQYSPAIYFENEEEEKIAEEVVKEIEKSKKFDKPLTVPILPRKKFWPAEEYHQNYAKKNKLKYKAYRVASGRDLFFKKHE